MHDTSGMWKRGSMLIPLAAQSEERFDGERSEYGVVSEVGGVLGGAELKDCNLAVNTESAVIELVLRGCNDSTCRDEGSLNLVEIEGVPNRLQREDLAQGTGERDGLERRRHNGESTYPLDVPYNREVLLRQARVSSLRVIPAFAGHEVKRSIRLPPCDLTAAGS